jgi:hypothetical protein
VSDEAKSSEGDWYCPKCQAYVLGSCVTFDEHHDTCGCPVVWHPASFEQRVTRITRQVRDLLIEKNAKYGNSALEPARIFSKASPVEQILVRIDDKLSRIRTSGLAGADEDTALDLIGYLVLLRVAKECEIEVAPQNGDRTNQGSK